MRHSLTYLAGLLALQAALVIGALPAASFDKRAPATFDCAGERLATLTVDFIGKKKARLSLDGESIIARASISASGALYRGADVEFWNKGDDAVVEWRDEKFKCTLRR